MEVTFTLPVEWKELSELLPLDSAMAQLKGSSIHEAAARWVESHQSLAPNAHSLAGLWLYVGDLDRSHGLSQGLDDSTGAAWHAVMHRREGDHCNSKYWYRRAEGHPALRRGLGMEPQRFVDLVAKAAGDDPELLDLQRREWLALFEHSLQMP